MAVYIEFDKVKSLKIPEGDVRKIEIGGKTLWQYTYVWDKYTRYLYDTSYGIHSGAYKTETLTSGIKLCLWPREQRVADGSAIVDTGKTQSDQYGESFPIYKIVYGTGFSYGCKYGTFTLTGKTYDEMSVLMSYSNYDIESTFIGKYVIYNGDAYKITGHDDVRSLILGERYYRGDLLYGYKYRYDGEVTSTDPNAYKSSTSAPSTNSTQYFDNNSSSNINSIYVKKGW